MKGKKAGVIGGIGLLLLIVLFALSSYYIYQNAPGEAQELKIKEYNPDINLDGVSNKVKQFYPNMRFNHNDISYYIHPNCVYENKVDRIEEAFDIISTETEILTFYSINDENESDILIGCSPNTYEREENLFIAGEGGPTKIVDSSLYPIILKGKILLYEDHPSGRGVNCDKPITELHEILHVFGFDHIDDPTKIMYPYVECEQEIGREIIQVLVTLYSTEALPELYFEEVNATKSGRYLDFSASIRNGGLIDAKNVKLEVYEKENLLDSFELGDIEFGAGKVYSRTNFKLNSKDATKVTFKITSSNNELDDDNNIIELETS